MSGLIDKASIDAENGFVPGPTIEIRVSQPARNASDHEPTFPPYDGPAVLSFGFRPFFLGAAMFAAIAVPVWISILNNVISSNFLYAPREWHVHEMLFGFLPAVMTGFLLTAVPNWTGRAPLTGAPLASLWAMWLAGRILVAVPGPVSLIAAIVDAGFLVVVAGIIWREIAAAQMWSRSPIVILISLYACAHILFQALALRGAETDIAERTALSIVLLLLTIIGGRVTPAFTADYLAESRAPHRPASFSRFDAVSMLLVLIGALVWVVRPGASMGGALFVLAGLANLVRLARWRGWMAWREPLVFVLHLGYGWVALSLLALGSAIFDVLPAANAVHVLTTGAVGTMTLAVMTRASLGHTGRRRHAGLATTVIYVLVMLGAIFRVLTPTTDAPMGLSNLLLGIATLAWSGAYLLYVLVYGKMLVSPSVEE